MSDDIQRSLGRIEGKLDSVLERQKSHEDRLDTLDAIKNKGYGILTAITVAAGAVGASVRTAISGLMSGGTH